ncbi:RraA family protein [Streptomyces scopuliridis]|uniref:Putative 4-hydroxy-4-methyl-2-oxoglutarate aldolase n=1 Tax=Streptomyces scopuliridis RB72 TaxID=1440053 RepID=A0A2T7T9I6_9ACTN|nr:dimethylmenaquinone methyltransferase [Streptomyces scopuliridis]PVE11778.1 demethylmenaquinone methyltransferase [Streptomyces scopuliridis RB72]
MTLVSGRDGLPAGQALLLERLARIDFPTLGHLLEDGFVSPAIRRLGLPRRMIGIASTLALDTPDAGAVNRAILELGPADVLVIDAGGAPSHAVIGAVTVAALHARGASGVLVDGVVTDIDALADPGSGICVHARGTSCLTTKRLGGEGGRRQVPVEVGGVRIDPGDLVLGDANGVIALRPQVLASVLDAAEETDAREPALLRAIADGEDPRTLLHLG